MQRSKKMVVIANCILNVNAKVEGIACSQAGQENLIYQLMKMGYGIIQLPCVEQDMCGIARWGQVENQLNHPHFRARCRELLTPIVYQVEDFQNHGYKVCAVIGLDGSPSCGVNETCAGDWSGEIGEGYNVMERAATCHSVKKSGVMIQVLGEMLKERQIQIPFMALDESHPAQTEQGILNQLKEQEQ